jgi:hypothetical protein
VPPFNAPSWRALVTQADPGAEFAAPASETAIRDAERALAVELPAELQEVLAEFDGLTAGYGESPVWSVAEIERANREFREQPDFRDLYMPFHHLLFFGEDGGGDLFAFAIQAGGRINRPDIFRWDHETDAREWYAPRLEQYLQRRLTDE